MKIKLDIYASLRNLSIAEFARRVRANPLALFAISFALASASFYAFVKIFPFPTNNSESLAQSLHWVKSLTPPSNDYKYWYPVALIYIPLSTFFGWLLLNKLFSNRIYEDFYPNSEPAPLQKLSVFELTWVSASLFVLLTNFSYAAFYAYLINFHHFNYITGPLNDVLNGRFLLVDVKSQYGFLNIFLTSWIFKYFLYFSHGNVHFLSMIFILLEYLAFYFILKLMTRSIRMALLGIVLIFSYHYFGMYPALFPSELAVWPGYTWRYFMSSMALLLVLYWHLKRSTVSLLLSQASVALAFFWQFESGISVLGSYISLLCADFLLAGRGLDFKSQGRGSELLSRLTTLALWMLGVATGYSVYAYIYAGTLPDWSNLVYYTKTFNNGFLQGASIPSQIWWYWPILVYSCVLFLLFGVKFLKLKFPREHLPYLVFLSVFGFGIFRYYLGYGNDNVKPSSVVIPACIIFVYFCSQLFLGISKGNLSLRRPWTASAAMLATAIFVHAAIDFSYWSVKLNQQRWLNKQQLKIPDHNVPEKNRLILIDGNPPTIPFPEFVASLEKIKKYVPAHQPIALIAYLDHPILMQSERVNLAHYWYMHTDLYTQKELDEVAELYISKAEFIFVEKGLMARSGEHLNKIQGRLPESNLIEIFRKIRPHYSFQEDIGLLYVYRKN